MTVVSGHFTLTPGQKQFKDMLDAYPSLQPFWDFDKRECDIVTQRDGLNTLSHGEQIMVRFFAAIWLGENALSFDLIEAVKGLDETNRQVILDWLADPVFP